MMIKNLFKSKNFTLYALNLVKQEQYLSSKNKFYFSVLADEDITDPSQ